MNLPTRTFMFSAVALILGIPISAAFAGDWFSEQEKDWQFMRNSSSPLVDAVRAATAQYQDVDAAMDAGYMPMFGCVSSPDEGAMGAHLMNFANFLDGVVDVDKPELLVYQPMRNGKMRLVAVEYLEDATMWDAAHPPANGLPGVAPYLVGQIYNFDGAPNRFRAGASYSLHVWAWKYNPSGMFAKWNPRVSCRYYAGP